MRPRWRHEGAFSRRDRVGGLIRSSPVSASKHRSVTYERAGELVDQLKLEIAELMEHVEAADGGEDDDLRALPEEIARRRAGRAPPRRDEC